MLNRSLVTLSLLLPALSLAAPGCDKADSISTVGDADEADTDSEDESESDTEDEPESESEGESESDTEGESESDTEDEPEPEPKPDSVVPCAETPDMACELEGGEEGVSICIEVDGEEVWTGCSNDHECYPGEGWDQGCLGSICAWDGEKLYSYSWEEPDCNTPLVVNFDDMPLRFEAAGAAAFDISGVGECLSTDWPTLPWLALDRDGDGVISSGRELFGSGVVLGSGFRASHGFEALAELDADGDGKITAADPAFAELVLWSDHDDDRRGDLAELVPVSAVDLLSIDLNFDRRVECDARGNCGGERSAFEFRDAAGTVRSGELVDVYLACQ